MTRIFIAIPVGDHTAPERSLRSACEYASAIVTTCQLGLTARLHVLPPCARRPALYNVSTVWTLGKTSGGELSIFHQQHDRLGRGSLFGSTHLTEPKFPSSLYENRKSVRSPITGTDPISPRRDFRSTSPPTHHTQSQPSAPLDVLLPAANSQNYHMRILHIHGDFPAPGHHNDLTHPRFPYRYLTITATP
jgi:hypothetical protein